jgi:hypothetical protein
MLTEPNTSHKYTEREQTAEQRQQLIDMARAWSIADGATPGPVAEGVYARYVAGELTLQGVTDELVSYYQQRGKVPRRPGSRSRAKTATIPRSGL